MTAAGPGASSGEFYAALVEDDPSELYESAPCGYVSTTPSGTIVKANRTFLSWTGYQSGDLLLARKFQSLLPIGDRVFYETHFAPTLTMQGSVREIAVDLVCASGDRLPVLLNAVLQSHADGTPLAIRIAVFDARERRSYEHELVAARDAAERAAAEARALAETLQRTLLPPELPAIEDLDIGGAYRPAGDGSVVGGDFYDVFELGERTWGVSLGDVCGKGAAAAVVTALTRYTLRAEAVRSRSPADALRGLHDAVERSEGRTFLTAIFARVTADEAGVRLTVAVGGHHLPLRIATDGTIEEVGQAGALLGMLGPPRLHDVELELRAGEALVLYTDGVIEARSGDRFLGEDGLHDVLTANRGASAQELADAVASAAVEFQDGVTRDDIAVVVLTAP